jgi:hypothetical protein
MLESNQLTHNTKVLSNIHHPISVDLRKSLAKIISRYAMAALPKGITMDIYVAQEIPNYFQGNIKCFLEIFALLLELNTKSIDKGAIEIRIYHESLHQCSSNVELSIMITTTHFNNRSINDSSISGLSGGGCNDRKKMLEGLDALPQVNSLCNYVDGALSCTKKSDSTIQFNLKCVLQQSHTAGILSMT